MGSKSKKLFGEAKKIIPSRVNSPVRFFKPYPFFVKNSKGGTIWDEDGRHYIDYCNGYGALLLGHARREIISAVSAQLKKGTLYTFPTALEVELSKLNLKLKDHTDLAKKQLTDHYLDSYMPWPHGNTNRGKAAT